MHAIILAAGRGNRLAEHNPEGLPKCLMEFGGRSLLARHLELLLHSGVRDVDLVIGYEADRIIDHIGTLSVRPDVAFVDSISVAVLRTQYSTLIGARAIRVVAAIDGRTSTKQGARERRTAVVLKGAKQRIGAWQIESTTAVAVQAFSGGANCATTVRRADSVGHDRVLDGK